MTYTRSTIAAAILSWRGPVSRLPSAPFYEDFVRLIDPTTNPTRNDVALEECESTLARHGASPNSFPAILVRLMYESAFRIGAVVDYEKLGTLGVTILRASIARPGIFIREGDAEIYVRFLHGVSQQILKTARKKPTHKAVSIFVRETSFLDTYFARSDLRPLFATRAEISRLFMSAAGAKLDYSFSPLSRSRSRRIRVGLLCSDFSARSETFVAIPFFRHLDRTRFETLLLSQHRFAIDSHSSALAKLVDHAIVLPRDLNQQVLLIRGLQLDALVIGTNITAVQSTTFLLTLHRLAPVQIANCCSPTSTGNPVIDYFLSGSLAEGSAKPETLYSENLLMLQGTGLCFDYSFDPTKPARIDRTKLGISQDMIVFTSGANMNKIGPEVRRAWAHILSRTPNSVLILYPYGTAWQRSYPRKAFEAEMRSALAQAGVEEKRIRFLNALSSRSNVKAVLRLSDVYLDSFPYGGANTMIDPLELGIPSVAMRGPYQRFNQGAAILDDLGIPDLAANDAEDYCRLAVTLGTKPMIRKQLSKVIKDNIKEVPKFLNTVDYGSQLGSLLTKICRP